MRAAFRRVERDLAESLPARFPRWFAKAHAARQILFDDRKDPARRAGDLGWTVWNLAANRLSLRSRPGRLITLSGPDGAGKSRVADTLASTLELCEVPVTRLWSRGGFSAPAVAAKAVARRLLPAAVPGARDEAGKRAFLKRRRLRAFWTWMIALEQALSLARVRWPLLLGRTVICDRWIFDTLADLAGRTPGGAEALRASRAASFLISAVPSPDLAFLIDIDPEVAHARKSDGTTLESRRALSAAYSGLLPMASFIRIDGGAAWPDTAQESVIVCLRRTFEAFEGKTA
jgi:dTMP kinase